jgi:hypothetical protein
MNGRTSIIGRLRRWNAGAARYVVGAVAVAYLSTGVAPCAMASHAANDTRAAESQHVDVSHAGHAQHDGRDVAEHSRHGHDAHRGFAAAHEDAPAPVDQRGEHCPHCPAGTAIAHDSDGLACATLEDLTNVAASHLKDVAQPLAPLLGSAAFTLPPPLASPRAPPSRAAAVPPVPLNVRHCVFLI